MHLSRISKVIVVLLTVPVLLMGAKCDRENYHGPGSGPALDPLFEQEDRKEDRGSARCQQLKQELDDSDWGTWDHVNKSRKYRSECL